VKVTYYSKYSSLGPSSRYRIFQFLELFRNDGIDVTIQPLFDDPYFRFLRTTPSAALNLQKSLYVASRFENRRRTLNKTEGDLTVIEQQLFPYLPFLLEKPFLPTRYLLELDDAIYLTHPKKLPKVIENAAGVIVGNQTIGGVVAKYNSNVHLIPTVLNTDLFRSENKVEKDKITIGWSGLEYNFKYLQKLRQVFLYLVTTFPVEIVILSGSEPKQLDFPFRFEKWDPDKEVSQISQFDIGIMPLEMDEWSRSKCGMKLLQYMSLEVPSVATPAGVNAEIIQDGVNGFTALSEEEWIHRISQMVQDPALRVQVGKAGRNTVIEKYSVKSWFPKLLEVYRQYAL
jgi:glycosyltransferase involved in cell wall biosynthesis